MSEKLKTAKELGIPKGFTLSNKNRTMIVKAAVKKQFLEQAQDIQDREWALMVEVNEDRYPPKDLEEYKKLIIQASILISGEPPKDEYIITETTRVFINTKFFNIYIGQEKNWGDSRDCCHDMGIPDNIQSIPVTFKPKKDPFTKGNDIELLSKYVQTKVIKFKDAANAFEAEVKAFKGALREVLQSFSSVIQLCNMHEEFIGWIRLAHGMEEDPGHCSDIPSADSMADVRKIIKGEIK